MLKDFAKKKKGLGLLFVLTCHIFFYSSSQADSPLFCQNQIHFEEKSKGIEAGLLEAIATIESKLNPYVVNVQGNSHHFRNLQTAVDFVQSKLNRGIQNISVGPMQLHVPSHRRHFKSLKDMIDPVHNIRYAAGLFMRLKRRYGSCEKAVRYYHSSNPNANRQYKDRVFGAWARIKKKRPRPALSPQLISGCSVFTSKDLSPIQREGLLIVKSAYHLRSHLSSLTVNNFIKDQTSPCMSLSSFPQKSPLFSS